MANTPFVPPPGLTSEDTTFNSPGRWKNGSLARFYEGNWQVKGGWESLTLTNLGGVCRSVYPWTDNNSVLNIAFGCHNSLQVFQEDVLLNVTPTSFVAGPIDGSLAAGYGTSTYGTYEYGEAASGTVTSYYPLTWSLGNWGGYLVANPRGQTIFVWNGSGIATPMPNAPAQVTYMLSVPQRQIMALGCNEEISGTFNPLCIRFSDIEDYTDWTTQATNNAGEYILESGGRIVCGRIVGDYVFVWTLDGLFVGTFVGSPSQTWKFERMAFNCGSISPGSPCVASQNVAWMAPDLTHWTMSLGAAPTLMGCDVRQMFVHDVAIGQQDKIVAGTTATFSELQWFYPDDRDGLECSRGIAVSPNGWSHDYLARSAYCDAGVSPYPIGVAPTGEIYYHEKGVSADGQPLTGFIESCDFYLGDADGGVLISRIWPDIKQQQGSLSLTLYTRYFPQDTERVHGPWTLAPGQSQRSLRVAGRIARMRYDFSAVACYARGGKTEVDVAPIGGR